MSSPNQQEWQPKIKDLKLGNKPAPEATPDEPRIPEILSNLDSELFEVAAWQEKLAETKNWFEQMSGNAKIAVLVGVVIVGFMLLKTVFQLVTSLMTLGVVGVVLWFGYRYFIGSKVDSEE